MGTNTYAQLTEFDKHFNGFLDEYYGTYLGGTGGTVLGAGSTLAVADLNRHYRLINDFLDSLGRFKRLPIGTQADGSYPQSLIDLNTVSVIGEKLMAVHSGEITGEIPEWIMQYLTYRSEIRTMIKEGQIIFEEEISVAETGVGAPVVVSMGADTVGEMDSNWDGYAGEFTMELEGEQRLRPQVSHISGYTKGYQGEDFPRWWHVKVDGTTGGNEIGEATFKYSITGGATWEDTGLATDDDWYYLGWGVYIRFTFSGGTSHFNYDDEWKFYCVPKRIRAEGNTNLVRVREFIRG